MWHHTEQILILFLHSDPRVELRNVKEELAVIEQQLEELLERQYVLTNRKQQLEQEIRDQAACSRSSEESSDWKKTGEES